MHEIITIQLGQEANYVGTHFWNAQESYFTYGDEAPSIVNHDINFRSGLGADRSETYTPRALIYDLKGGFGAMRKVNALYDAVEQGDGREGLWDNGVTTTRQTPIEMVQYQKDLEAGVTPPTPLTTNEVRYWSDFNRVYFHPRSSVQIPEYQLDDKLAPFERYEFGKEVFQQHHREEDILDRDFRLFAEECDQLQGVQFIAGVDDGWGGFLGSYLEELRDEYSKLTIVTWGLEKGTRVLKEKQAIRTVALAKTLATAVPLSSLYIPLTNAPAILPKYVSVDRASQWHTSALLSAAYETITLPTRLQESVITGSGRGGRLEDMVSLLTGSGNHRIAQLSMSLGGDEKDGNQEPAAADDNEADLEACKPNYRETVKTRIRINCSWDENALRPRWEKKKKDHTFVETNVVRGFDENTVEDAEEDADAQGTGYGDRRSGDMPKNSRAILDLPYPIVDSFPLILPSYGNGPVESPVRAYSAVDAYLTTSSVVIDRIARLRAAAAFHVGIEEREVLQNDLDELVDDYRDGWDSDEEFDDDS